MLNVYFLKTVFLEKRWRGGMLQCFNFLKKKQVFRDKGKMRGGGGGGEKEKRHGISLK